jgi:hypothetical protein
MNTDMTVSLRALYGNMISESKTKIHNYIIQNILLEPFAKQHLYNNSSVKNKKGTGTNNCAPLTPSLALYRIVWTASPRQWLHLCINRYGSAIIFFLRPRQGCSYQRWVSKFAVQTANQYYDVMVTRYASKALEQDQNILHDNCTVELNEAARDLSSDEDEEATVELSGKYSLLDTNELLQLMRDRKD